jgi:hypothetical protein
MRRTGSKKTESFLDGRVFYRPLDLFGDKVAFEAAGADLQGYRGALYFGLYLEQIRLPGAAGMILGVTHLIAGDGVFSTNIADTGHNKPSLRLKIYRKSKIM